MHLFDTWSDLKNNWSVAQGLLVDLLSENLTRSDPKAWEGYLALFTTAHVTPEDRPEVSQLRYNTHRVRKLVATGDDLVTLKDVTSALFPLLPLDVEVAPAATEGGLLDQLPTLVQGHDVPDDAVRVVVDAFRKNESTVERLHAWRVGQ